jgi:hypothetical protein
MAHLQRRVLCWLCDANLSNAIDRWEPLLPQNPVSKPTEKQLLSLLKLAEREYGPTDSSITCRVSIVIGDDRSHEGEPLGTRFIWEDGFQGR